MKYLTLALTIFAFSTAASAAQTLTTKSYIAKDRFSANAFVGIKTFTGGLGDINSNGEVAGVEANYSLNSNFSLGLAYSTGSNYIELDVPSEDFTLSGSSKITTFSMFGKYFIQKSKLSPYILFGFSQINRIRSDFNSFTTAGDSSGSFDVGVGTELKFNKGRNFLSLQALYSRVNFSNENNEILTLDDRGDSIGTGITPDGDILSYNLSFGVYF